MGLETLRLDVLPLEGITDVWLLFCPHPDPIPVYTSS